MSGKYVLNINLSILPPENYLAIWQFLLALHFSELEIPLRLRHTRVMESNLRLLHCCSSNLFMFTTNNSVNVGIPLWGNPSATGGFHDDVIEWKHVPRYWPFVRGIHRSPVNSPHKGKWRGALIFSFICARINDWVNNCEAGDLKRHRAYYDALVLFPVVMWNAPPCQDDVML